MTQNMSDDDYQARIKVTLGLLGMTGVLLLVGSVVYFINQISGNSGLD